MLYDNFGYLGRDKIIVFIRERFFWFGMIGDIE